MTLSKIRNLKRDIANMSALGVEFSTLALGWVYFERLLFQKFVKQNRKLLAGVCIILAHKFNQGEQSQLTSLKNLISGIRDLDRKDELDSDDLKRCVCACVSVIVCVEAE